MREQRERESKFGRMASAHRLRQQQPWSRGRILIRPLATFSVGTGTTRKKRVLQKVKVKKGTMLSSPSAECVPALFLALPCVL